MPSASKHAIEASSPEALSVPAAIQRARAATDGRVFNEAFADAAAVISSFSHGVIHRQFPAMQHSDREIVVQETLVTLWRSLDVISTKRNPAAWVAITAHSRAIDLLRSQNASARREHGTTSRPRSTFCRHPLRDPRTASPLELALQAEEERRFNERFIREFSPAMQEMLELRADGLRYREIASAQRLPISTIRARLRKARSELQQWVADSKDRLPA